MRVFALLVAICFSGVAFAQGAAPKAKVGSKGSAQVRPKGPIGCKLVGTVRGTKLWAGDCVSSELRGTTSPAESQPAPEPPPAGAPPGQKE
jgi:hypothetical protein